MRKMAIRSIGRFFIWVQIMPFLEGISGALALYADDDAVSRNQVCAQLKDAGARVLLASDGFQAIEKAKQYRPDFLLLDMYMPECSGLEAADRLLRHSGSTTHSVILLTSRVTEEITSQATDLGIRGVLSKPLDLEALRSLLHNHPGPSEVDCFGDADESSKVILKAALFKTIAAAYDMEFKSSIVEEFRENTAAAIENIKMRLKDRKMHEIELDAHRAAGLSNVLGAQKLAEHFNKLEIAASLKDMEEVRSLAVKTQQLFDVTIYCMEDI